VDDLQKFISDSVSFYFDVDNEKQLINYKRHANEEPEKVNPPAFLASYFMPGRIVLFFLIDQP